MEEKNEREEQDKEYEGKKEEMKRKDEEKTKKNQRKREKLKARKGKGGKLDVEMANREREGKKSDEGGGNGKKRLGLQSYRSLGLERRNIQMGVMWPRRVWRMLGWRFMMMTEVNSKTPCLVTTMLLKRRTTWLGATRALLTIAMGLNCPIHNGARR